MAIGTEDFRDPTTGIKGILLEDQAGATDGVWQPVEGYEKKSIHLDFSDNANCKAQVFVSNRPTKPANNVDDIQYGNDYSASALAEIKIPVKWIKVKMPANDYQSGVVNAWLQGCP